MRVCVVEDEKTLRESIVYKLSKLSTENEIFDIEYGFKAMERLLLLKPNLVFLDIFMPEINGLDMLRKVKGSLPNTKFIFLTGYGEFEYAREALQLGAKNYLLKPIYDKDLKKAVEEVRAELVREMEKEVKQDIRLLEQEDHEVSITSIVSPGWWFDSNKRKVIVMNNGHDDLLLENCIFQFQACKFGAGNVVVADQEDSMEWDFYDRSEWSDRLRRVLELCAEQQFFGEGAQCSLRRMEQPTASILKSAGATRQLLVSIIGSDTLNVERIYECFEQWTEQISVLPVRYVRSECVLLLSSLDGALQNCNTRFIEEADKAYWEDWVGMFTEWNILMNKIDYLIHKGLSALNDLKAMEKLTDYELMQRVQERVENMRDYREMSLDFLAEQFHIHPVSLSKLFKKHVGINFIQYATKRKMALAKKLLLHSSKKVSEITEELGYSNYRYFSTLFKKEYGIVPQQFRRNEEAEDRRELE